MDILEKTLQDARELPAHYRKIACDAVTVYARTGEIDRAVDFIDRAMVNMLTGSRRQERALFELLGREPERRQEIEKYIKINNNTRLECMRVLSMH